jgi:hypothetical protein
MITGLDFQLVNKAVLLPGALVLVLLSIYCVYIGITEKIPRQRFDVKEALAATWAFKWEIGVFALLIMSIKSQLAGIDEAAGLIAAYTLAIEVWIYKDITLKKDFVRIARGSMALAGAVILILAMANALVSYIGDEHLPNKVLDAMLKIGFDKTWQFLIVMNVFLLILGMIMDGFSAILVAVPLVLPFAAYFGLGPFHVAIMFVLNLELAFSCPPLGLNLFISSFRFNRPVISLYRLAMPFVGLLALALLIITYVPRISNALVLEDIQKWRDQAKNEKRVPSEAWFLECVQLDRNNPKPCSEEDKKAYPNGQMPEVVETKDAGPAAAQIGEEEDLDALIKGGDGAKDGGSGAAKAPGTESDEDLLALIKSDSANDAGADAASKPKPKPGQETDEELQDLIKGSH